MSEINIRPMEAEDIDAVLNVEQQSFSTPWSRAAFEAEIYHNDLAYYLVVVKDSKVIGYGGMWIILDEAHITNIAILPDYRSMGLGEKLLSALIVRAKAKGAVSMTLEVRVSNIRAQKLYTRLGFVAKGIRPQYYTDSHEDALIMWRDKL